MKRFPIAMRMLRRNASAGELRVLLVALFIAVASVTSVGFFADRVHAALDRQANDLLGGDLAVVADHPIPPVFLEAARAESLAMVETRSFPSMVSASGGVVLSEIKAASDGFPLRGRLRIAEGPDLPDREVVGGPKAGTTWVAPALLARTNAKVGDTLQVGRAKLTIAAVITREPDSVLDYFGLAPRVLIHLSDLESTGLIQVGSRVGYRLLVSGDAKAIERYSAAVKPKVARGERVEGVRDTRSEVRVALDRAQRFLGLASLLSVVLASVAVALSARRFSERQVDAAAMMRCLGATQADMFALHAWQFVALGVIGCVMGSAAGYVAQAGLARWLAGFFTIALPYPGILPGLRGAVIGFVLLLGFTLPPLLRLRNVSTLRVLRRDLSPAEPLSIAAFLLGLAALSALIIWQAGDLKMGGIALGGFFAALAVAALAGYVLIRLVSRARGAASGPWRYGLANLRRRTWGSLVQIMALGLGIMAMLLLTLVRTELISKWQSSMPPDMPNRFAVNVQSDQVADFRKYLNESGVKAPNIYPMIRGRLAAISDRKVVPADYKDDRARRLAEREFNLSWTDTLKSDNKVVAGEFWKADTREPQFSVEESIAKSLEINVGDTLTWVIAGSSFTAKVTSIRKVDWDSFRPNFFVVASPGVLDSYPASWITSFRLPPKSESVVAGLVQRFPNVSVIDLTEIMLQVERITDQVSRAVEFVFVFAIAAGLVVLFAAITSTQDERIFEGAILRTLGASRRQMMILQLAEFLAIGLLAGTVAAAGAVALAMVLSDKVLGVPYDFHWQLPLAGLLAGGIGVAIAGLIGTRRAVASPPLQSLRAVT